MQITAPLLALFCLPLMAEPSVSKVAFTTSERAIHAFSPNGEVTLEVVRVDLDIRYQDGKQQFGNIVVVRDTQSEHYFWRFTPHSHTGESGSVLGLFESGKAGIYSGPDGIVDFYMPGALFIKEHAARAASLDAALTASIEEIRRGLAVFEWQDFHMDYQQVSVRPGSDFYCVPVRPVCGSQVKKVVSIRREGDNWRLVVRNLWDLEIILDSKFRLVSTQRAPTSPEK
jgi:hypothetical protein